MKRTILLICLTTTTTPSFASYRAFCNSLSACIFATNELAAASCGDKAETPFKSKQFSDFLKYFNKTEHDVSIEIQYLQLNRELLNFALNESLVKNPEQRKALRAFVIRLNAGNPEFSKQQANVVFKQLYGSSWSSAARNSKENPFEDIESADVKLFFKRIKSNLALKKYSESIETEKDESKVNSLLLLAELHSVLLDVLPTIIQNIE